MNYGTPKHPDPLMAQLRQSAIDWIAYKRSINPEFNPLDTAVINEPPQDAPKPPTR